MGSNGGMCYGYGPQEREPVHSITLHGPGMLISAFTGGQTCACGSATERCKCLIRSNRVQPGRDVPYFDRCCRTPPRGGSIRC